MTNAILPKQFEHQAANDLIRLGRDNDGGYVVSKSDVAATDILISLGVNDDWSFEEDFVAQNNVPVIAYDGSISEAKFRRRFTDSVKTLSKPARMSKNFRTYQSYKKFFTGNRIHVGKFVGLDTAPNYLSLATVLEKHLSKKIFLKIDIEGSEYRILDEILEFQESISGMVVEFHDCDLHLQRIMDFDQRLSLNLVHLHPNNFAPLNREKLPLVLEMTFSTFAQLSDIKATYPSKLDQPNYHKREEIVIGF